VAPVLLTAGFVLPAIALLALLLRGRSVMSGLVALPLVLSPSVAVQSSMHSNSSRTQSAG
jgi:ABC-type molybdate transport system permease subunit